MEDIFVWFLSLTAAQRKSHIKTAKLLCKARICYSLTEAMSLIYARIR